MLMPLPSTFPISTVVRRSRATPHAALERDSSELEVVPKGRARDVVALTGALSVLLIVASFVVWGNTPKGDASAAEVFAHYSDSRTQGLIAAVLLAVSTIPLMAFAASLRERARAVMPDSMLPSFALGAGIVAAAGFIGAAGVHLALSDYGRDIDLAAAQALNALDADSFMLFTAGLSALVLAGSLIALRSHLLSPWLGWAGIIVAIAIFTPVGFFASCAAGAWIIATSIILYLRARPEREVSTTPAAARPEAGMEAATS